MSPSLTTARQILTNLSAAFALGLSAPVDSPLMLFLLFALRPSHHASWRFILCISDVSVFLKHIVNRILCSSFRWYSKAFLKTHCHVHVFRLYTYWYLYVITSGIVIYLLDKSLLSFWYFWWIPNLQKLILKMKLLWDEAWWLKPVISGLRRRKQTEQWFTFVSSGCRVSWRTLGIPRLHLKVIMIFLQSLAVSLLGSRWETLRVSV